MRLARFRFRAYDVLRRRVIRETETSLSVLFDRGDQVPRIPTVEAGKGVFNPAYAARYWANRLDLR